MGKQRVQREKSNMKFCSFSVSGGAYCYQMGIARHIQSHFDLSDVLFSGASGGTWPALLLAAGVDIQYAYDVMMKKSVPCYAGRALGAYGCYDLGMKAAFYHIFDGVDLPAKVNGRLALCVTRIELWPFPHLENEMVSHFTSNDDIIECIIASALIPFALNGRPYVVYRNWICIDGGTTNIAGVRKYALPSQLDFDQDTTKDDNMHIVARLRAVLSVFARLKTSLQLPTGNSYGMPHFRPFAEYPISIPMAIEPFGVYGHSVSIISSVVHEVYHSVAERVESLPGAVKARLAQMLRLSQEAAVEAVGGEPGLALAELGGDAAEAPAASASESSGGGSTTVLDAVLSLGILNWIFKKPAQALLVGAAQGVEREEDSWWVRNEYQIHQARESSVAVQNMNKNMSDPSIGQAVDSRKDVSCGSSYSDFSVVEKEGTSSVGGSFATVTTPPAEPLAQDAPTSDAEEDISGEADTTSASAGSGSAASSRGGQASPVDGSSGSDGGGAHRQPPALKKTTKRGDQKRVYWRRKAEAVSATPCGGTQLLITPWMWRKLPLSAYHLTSRSDSATALLELGIMDAAEHHMELLKFFSPSEYMNSMMHYGAMR